MLRANQAVWLAGFRPFFILACVAGVVLPLAWAGIFSGALPTPPSRLSSVQWHAHEMIFGFGWAVLGGFLLTSTKNWVGVRGYHGRALAYLAAAWSAERITVSFGQSWHPALWLLGANLFLGSIVAMLCWTLIRHRAKDSYRDNLIFLIALPVFLVTKNMLMQPATFAAGYTMSLALFRVAFIVMLERTLTQFMRSAFQVEILRHRQLDMAIKILALALVPAAFLPTFLTQAAALVLAALMLGRLFFWHPMRALRRIDLGIMYIGYAAIVGQLLLDGSGVSTSLVGSAAVHLFTFGAMGCVIPAMIVRIANGHTGRKVVFQGMDRAILWIMIAALIVRVVLTQCVPALYTSWIQIAALCWAAGFALLAWRVVPMLMHPRIDGREH